MSENSNYHLLNHTAIFTPYYLHFDSGQPIYKNRLDGFILTNYHLAGRMSRAAES